MIEPESRTTATSGKTTTEPSVSSPTTRPEDSISKAAEVTTSNVPPSSVGELIDPAMNSPESAVIISASSFRGPLPPPDLLREYNDIIPQGADRVMRMAEESLAHRKDMDRSQIELAKEQLAAQREDARAARVERRIGQIGGLLIIIGAFVLTVWIIKAGHPWAGSIFGIGGIAGLAGTYMYGHKQDQVERVGESNKSAPDKSSGS